MNKKLRGVFVSVSMFTVALFYAEPAALAGAPQAKSKTVWDGAYTMDQAARGKAEFAASCSGCHGIEMTGNRSIPPLVGERFTERWREDSLDKLFRFMKSKMPAGTESSAKPPSLSDSTYLDLLGHILQSNNFPSGAEELNVDTLKGIQVVGKDGPKPLPNSALVLVVGCLTAGPNDAWTLNNTGEPVRAEQPPEEMTAEEKASSASKSLGALTFKLALQNLDFIHPGFTPDPYKGHKVRAKGILSRQPNGDRVTVSSLETIASSCAP